MWRIMKTELKYSLNVTIWAFGFLLFMFFLYFVSGNGPIQVYVAMTAILITPMLGGYAWDFRVRQRRDYFFLKFAVPLNQLAVFRLFYTAVLWLMTVCAFWLILFLFSLMRALVLSERVLFNWFHAPSVMNFLWLNGLILIINALYMIVTDKKANRPDGPCAFIYEGLKYVLSLVAMAPFYLAVFLGGSHEHLQPLKLFEPLFSSPASVLLFNMAGWGLCLLSIRVFLHRESYIHS